MPDPIQCTLDRSQAIPTYDCEPVEISSTPTNQTSAEAHQCLADDAGQAAADPAPRQAVQSLVKAVTPAPVAMPPVSVPPQFALDALGLCPSPVLDVGLVIAAAASGIGAGVALLAGAKVGTDLGQCLAPQYARKSEELNVQAAEDYCRSDGGTPQQWLGNRLQCVYPESQP